MYHDILETSAEQTYFAVSRPVFAAHLDAMLGLGVSVCTLEEAVSHSRTAPVALTFDDGRRTHYECAFPTLVERGLTATFFVTTSWVGTPGHVTWAQLREMAAAGMSIQSHTVTHPFLSELGAEEVRRELISSKTAIEQEIGRPCTAIALPGGDAPRGANLRLYATLGYRIVATSRWGPNRWSDARSGGLPLMVRRYTIRRGTSLGRIGRLARAASPVFAPEGLRLAALHGFRSAVGATRYAAWRRRWVTRHADEPAY